MAFFSPTHLPQSKVHHTEYIRTENEAKGDAPAPAVPVKPAEPKTA